MGRLVDVLSISNPVDDIRPGTNQLSFSTSGVISGGASVR